MTGWVAEAAIRTGLPCFPCLPDKKPACANGCLRASRDPDVIREMWARWPGPAIGMATGTASGLTVIDFDPKGLPYMRARLRRKSLPETRIHQTPRGGYHFIYLTPAPAIANSAGKLHLGVDVRGQGGYVVWPPSLGYRIVNEAEPARFPGWIIAALRRWDAARIAQEARWAQEQRSGDIDSLTAWIRRELAPGCRNQGLFWAACRAGQAGVRDGSALIAAGIDIGLDFREAWATVKSGLATGARSGGN